jgi:hypothetical protein
MDGKYRRLRKMSIEVFAGWCALSPYLIEDSDKPANTIAFSVAGALLRPDGPACN